MVSSLVFAGIDHLVEELINYGVGVSIEENFVSNRNISLFIDNHLDSSSSDVPCGTLFHFNNNQVELFICEEHLN